MGAGRARLSAPSAARAGVGLIQIRTLSDGGQSPVEIARLLDRVSPAIAVHLSRYLSGARDFVETGWALQADALMEHPQATLLFANQFRGFTLAYTWGRNHPGDMWSRYEALLKGETLEKGASERVWRATG